MSAQPTGPQTCPHCGFVLPPGAKYCPQCGARVAEEIYDAGALRDALNDVVPEVPPAAPILPTEQSTPPAPTAPPQPQSWSPPETNPPPVRDAPTALPPASGYQPGGMPPSAPVYSVPKQGWRENRTLWIVLAIFGFIVFCCCALGFVGVLAGSTDSSFQTEVSLAITLA